MLVNASRVLAASDPLSPEADRLEATLGQNVLATLRLSQIVARRMIELAEADAPRPRTGRSSTSARCRRAGPARS